MMVEVRPCMVHVAVYASSSYGQLNCMHLSSWRQLTCMRDRWGSWVMVVGRPEREVCAQHDRATSFPQHAPRACIVITVSRY
jgi:hypothetical protein